MKIQLDTEKKTIKVENEVNLKELFSAIKKILPEKEWETYKLIPERIIDWSYPIYIEKWAYPPTIAQPWYGTSGGTDVVYGQPEVTCNTSNLSIANIKTQTTFCIET